VTFEITSDAPKFDQTFDAMNAPRSSANLLTTSRSRRSTTHLKAVPDTLEDREALRKQCEAYVDKLDRTAPFTKNVLETHARTILQDAGLSEGLLGWTMVMLNNAFYREVVETIPPSRRLFLLPHCLKHAEGCPAEYDEFGMDCKRCGACSIADFRTQAEELGYRVLVAEGSPVVLKIIVSGYVDAIVGVACLNVLEKAIDKILLAGIPCMAVPLLSSDCRNTKVDESWVNELIQTPYHQDATSNTQTYLHLMRASSDMFAQPRLNELLQRQRSEVLVNDHSTLDSLDPIESTEAIIADFLSKGGKYSRPFITLAAMDAMLGGNATMPNGAEANQRFPLHAYRAAMAIEMFHKASLIHDDIEDDDKFRYGSRALHTRFGIPYAINLGDFLIGQGYRMVARESTSMGADAVADILNQLSAAHTRLAEGQGAELAWRVRSEKRLTPLDALKIYALKTAPAFEVALYTGIRLAGPCEEHLDKIKTFSRNIGVAFQILNDLKDWQHDSDNKLQTGADVLQGRPTVLLALALQALDDDDQRELMLLLAAECPKSAAQRLAGVRSFFDKANVFEQALRLVDKHQERAEIAVEQFESEPMRRLMFYLLDTVLERPSETMLPLAQLQVIRSA
jgi:geranylgeranyl diphosphate synthase, type II